MIFNQGNSVYPFIVRCVIMRKFFVFLFRFIAIVCSVLLSVVFLAGYIEGLPGEIVSPIKRMLVCNIALFSLFAKYLSREKGKDSISRSISILNRVLFGIFVLFFIGFRIYSMIDKEGNAEYDDYKQKVLESVKDYNNVKKNRL